MEPKLIHGDCLLVMRELPAESVDVVVTSPPYNLGIGYGMYRDTVPREAYLKWTVEWCREVKRLLKPNGCSKMRCVRVTVSFPPMVSTNGKR